MTGLKKRGLGTVLHGPEGIGKTDFCMHARKPCKIISMGEVGAADLIDVDPDGYPDVIDREIDKYEKLIYEVDSTQEGSFVVDSLSGLQSALWDYVCDTEFDGIFSKFMAYYTGPRKHCSVHAAKLCEKLTQLRLRGVDVFLIAHTIIVEVKNPKGPDYITYEIDLDDGIKPYFKKWAQAILFMNIPVHVNADEEVATGELRYIYTNMSPAHVAKNRLRLPNLIPMGDSAHEAYENFYKELPEVYR